MQLRKMRLMFEETLINFFVNSSKSIAGAGIQSPLVKSLNRGAPVDKCSQDASKVEQIMAVSKVVKPLQLEESLWKFYRIQHCATGIDAASEQDVLPVKIRNRVIHEPAHVNDSRSRRVPSHYVSCCQNPLPREIFLARVQGDVEAKCAA